MYKNNDNVEKQKDSFDFYKYLIELKYILKRENIFNILFESYKRHAEKISIKNIIQSKNKLNIYEEIKKGKFKKLRIDEIPSNIINLYEEQNRENIIKNSSYLFNPKISVNIPIYNSKNYLEDCLKSIIFFFYKIKIIIFINYLFIFICIFFFFFS